MTFRKADQEAGRAYKSCSLLVIGQLRLAIATKQRYQDVVFSFQGCTFVRRIARQTLPINVPAAFAATLCTYFCLSQ